MAGHEGGDWRHDCGTDEGAHVPAEEQGSEHLRGPPEGAREGDGARRRILPEARVEDRELRDNLQLVTISFDPEHDTPEVMAMHAAALDNSRDPGADWRFLTTSGPESLRPILAAYDQPVARKPDPDDAYGPLAHQLRVYLSDRGARVRNIYSLDFLDPRLVATDVRTLLAEERGSVARR